MNANEIQLLEDVLKRNANLAWINPRTDTFHKVTKIVSGSVANPKEPEADKCAMLGFSSKYVSLFDSVIEDFVIYEPLSNHV